MIEIKETAGEIFRTQSDTPRSLRYSIPFGRCEDPTGVVLKEKFTC